MDFDSWENIPKWRSYLDNTQLTQYYDTKIPFTLFHSTKSNVIARAEKFLTCSFQSQFLKDTVKQLV